MSLLVKKYSDLGPVKLFYNGTEKLQFSPSRWLWLRHTPAGLQPLDGVTGVIKATDGSAVEPILNWGIKKAFEKFRGLCITKHLGPNQALELFIPEMDAIIAEAKKAAKENLEDAGAVGSMAHEHLEKIAKATMLQDYPRLEELIAIMPPEDRAESCVTAAILWCVEHNLEWIEAERTVYHVDLGACGTMDNLVWADSCGNPACCPTPFKRRRCQVDYKSSNTLRTGYCLQTGFYTAAWEREFPEQVIGDRFILRLDKETAQFDPWHLEGRALQEQDFAAYCNALTHFRSFRAVEKRMDGIRDARRAEKAAEKESAKRAACPKSMTYKGVRKTACFPDGSQWEACKQIYENRAQKA
jgi:hypothetical protein